MKKSNKNKRNTTNEKDSAAPTNKRQKLNDEIPSSLDRPKSKKELRQERKAALKAKAEADKAPELEVLPTKVSKKEAIKQKRREEQRQENRAKREGKERALETRFQEQDRLRRERQQSPKDPQTKAKKHYKRNSATKKRKEKNPKQSEDYAVYKSLFKAKDPTTGATTCRLGVKYIDSKVGTGPVVQSKSLVTVKYQLRGGSPTGILIDSSKKFSFRLGKGEVIQGWEIGLEGMRQGGVRQLIVPPKAGYGGEDIGAGPGALLFFNVTLSEIVR